MRNPGLFLVLTLMAVQFTSLRSLAQSTYEPYTFFTLAGRARNYGSTDGTGSNAQFGNMLSDGYPAVGPFGVAVDSAGNVYVADTGNFTIRKVTSAGVVTTLAGKPNVFGSTDGTGSTARLRNPSGVAVDSLGNVYVADGYTIRKVTPAGVVSTLVGGIYGSADGTGRAARFAYARGIAVDDAGNVYVADAGNDTIRKVTPIGTNWVVTTLAGLAGKPGSADGTGGNARFGTVSYGGGPSGVAVDSTGNLYVADTGNGTIRKVTPVGVVTTLAGLAGTGGVVDGMGSAARFFSPQGIAVDSAGNVYVADSGGGGTIRKVTSAGMVTTLAGMNSYSGNPDGTGSTALFSNPSGVAVDSGGSVYVADTGNFTIRKGLPAVGPVVILTQPQSQTAMATITYDATFNVVANGALPLAYQWLKDGAILANATNSSYRVSNGGAIQSINAGAYSVVVSNLDGIVISSNALLTVTFPYPFISLAGSLWQSGRTDGTGSDAQFNRPQRIAVDSAGNIFVADTFNNTIRQATPIGTNWLVTTLAGLAGSQGSTDGTASVAQFDNPQAVAVDRAGNLYVADSGNYTIRKVSPVGTNWVVTTLAGLAGVSGSADGIGSAARFTQPFAVAVDAAGNVYVPDRDKIRKVTPAGAVTTLAGLAGSMGSADGIGSAARFSIPSGIAVDSTGNLYVADTFNSTIRKMTLAGTNWVVTTFAGQAFRHGYADGTGSAARFNFPHGVAVDSSGNIYVADFGNSIIRKVTPSGVVTTLGRAYSPTGIAVDSAGNIYVAESDRNVILKGFPPVGPPVIFTAPEGQMVELNADASVTLTVVANGAAPMSYQWQENGVDLAGATNNTFTLLNLQPGNAGIYRVVVSNALGSLASATAELTTFVRPPEIINQPQDQIEAEGYGYTFTPNGVATGTEPLKYQWLKDGAEIVGATNASLSIPNIQSIDAGAYGVVVINAYGSVISSNAELTITSPYTFTTLAGLAGITGSTDATGRAAQFNQPSSMAVDSAGNLYVADSENDTLRKVTPSGVVTTLAGLAGKPGSADGTGSVARLAGPRGVGVDSADNVYVADQGNSTIRKVTSLGVVTTLAGLAGNPGTEDGTGSAARFASLHRLAVDSAGNIYVTDADTIRKITPVGTNWIVTTLAGSTNTSGSADGTGSDARFRGPNGVAVDSAGNIYVADAGNNMIRKVTPTGVVTTLAGSSQLNECCRGNADGTGRAAQFNQPFGVAVDNAGNIYVADTYNYTIRKATPVGTNWVVTTLAGLAYSEGTADGTGSAAQFDHPFGIALDSAGNLYVADTFNNTIRKGFAALRVLNSGPGFGFNGSRFGFNLAGPDGQSVVVESSTDLLSWLPIWTNTFSGTLHFSDSQSGRSSQQFYRMRTR